MQVDQLQIAHRSCLATALQTEQRQTCSPAVTASAGLASDDESAISECLPAIVWRRNTVGCAESRGATASDGVQLRDAWTPKRLKEARQSMLVVYMYVSYVIERYTVSDVAR